MKSELTKKKEKLWKLCREIVRKRHGDTCYTCGKGELEGSNWQTGHFLTKSTCSTELAYDLDNLRPQCFRCNINLSGNWPAFERKLIIDHGREWVEDLKERNQKTRGQSYGAIWFDAKIVDYQNILKKL